MGLKFSFVIQIFKLEVDVNVFKISWALISVKSLMFQVILGIQNNNRQLKKLRRIEKMVKGQKPNKLYLGFK